MANIVLTHPRHGAKIAISDQEMLNDISNGWSRYADPVVESPVESMEQAEPINIVKRKGRPRKEDTPTFLMPIDDQ